MSEVVYNIDVWFQTGFQIQCYCYAQKLHYSLYSNLYGELVTYAYIEWKYGLLPEKLFLCRFRFISQNNVGEIWDTDRDVVSVFVPPRTLLCIGMVNIDGFAKQKYQFSILSVQMSSDVRDGSVNHYVDVM